MKRIAAVIMILSMILSLVPFVACSADSLYIIPESNTRKLSRDELWEYKYDTLMYAFNEIYARHGYKFETGSKCYNWFTQMPWYTPNASENSKNHHESYSQCSSIENYNVDLIKDVRREMREIGTLNSNGKGLPTPPDASVDKPRGFSYVNLAANMKLAVYTAPSYDAFRANNNKASCSTNGAVYALGYDGDWMLILYEANKAGQYRVGYVNNAEIKKGKLPYLERLVWDYTPCNTLDYVVMTDDPALTGKTLISIPAGTPVTYLTTMYNRTGWDYIETTIDGKIARGFIPSGMLDLLMNESDEESELPEG